MSREQFPVNHPEAWPTELRQQLEKYRKLLLDWEISPGSVSAPVYDNAMYALRNMLDSYAVTGWHCTRLTDAEIRHIQHRGMQLPDGAMLGRRIAMLEGTGEIPRDIALRLAAKNQADDSNRANKLWFCLFPPRLAGESGVSRFFRNWGGEALYNSHERDPETSPIIRRIGTPCIVEADVPIASLAQHGGLVFKIARRFLISHGYQTSEPVEHEDRSVHPIPAECVRRVFVYPEPDFLALTGCSTWREPLAIR